ncbi:MAG: enzyme of heme biosynthesis [Actinobacteria bacterium]|nr:enzyme of heme biosynthesis [Actinomycetota bacterium]
MKKLALTLLLALAAPNAFAADTGGSAPAPAPASTPAPVAATTPTPTPSPTPTPKYEVATPAPTPTQTVATSSLSSDLASIRGLIANKNYPAALTALKAADRKYPNNADINNLAGYSARNLKQYKAAGTYYAKALRVNPNHLGALEYQGELFVLTKKISAAKKNLAKLKTLCGINCEEYLELKQAIGNK